MSNRNKSFVFDRDSNWGLYTYLYNVKISENCLTFLQNSESASVFFSRSLDSTEVDTLWETLKVSSNVYKNSKIVFKIFASNSKEVTVPLGNSLRKINIDKFLRSKINFNTKIEFFDRIGALKFENPKHVPLFGLKGRYLWFCIESIGISSHLAKINEVEISFPNMNFIRYLPESYQIFAQESFINRFLYIFQSSYLDIEKVIDNIPENFEALHNKKNFLTWIFEWFKLNNNIFKNEKIYSLNQIINIFKIQGTKKSISKIVNKFIDSDHILIEKFKILKNDFYLNNKKLLDNLFGKNNFFFTIIILNNSTNNNKEFSNLLKIIRNVSPIDSICNIVILSKNISLGYHSYLGINSYINNNYMQHTHNSKSIAVIN